MRLFTGFAAAGLVAGIYLVCPESIRDRVNETLTPDAQTLVEVRDGIHALMRHLDGPGDINPDRPV